jgi:hypothetical protein
MKKANTFLVITTIISLLIAAISLLFGDNIVNRVKEVFNGKTSEIELLKDAEVYFFSGEYDKVKDLYNNIALKDNPIALNNLGYLYSIDLADYNDAFDETLKLASQCYLLSYNSGCNVALDNWILLNLTYPKTYSELIQALKYGYENNNIIALKYLSYIINGDIKTAKSQEFIDEFESMTDDDIVERIKEHKYEEVSTVNTAVPIPLSGLKDTDFTKYTYLDELETIVGVSSYWSTYYNEKKYEPIYAIIKYAVKCDIILDTGIDDKERFLPYNTHIDTKTK